MMRKNRYILLDIDGVLTSDHWSRKCRAEHRPANLFGLDWFDPDCIAALAVLAEKTAAGIIVSSSWRELGIDRLRHVWEVCGLPGELAGTTPEWVLMKDEAIQEWIHQHPEDVYVILDDADLKSDRQIRTNPSTGLTMADVERAISLLNV